MKRSFCIFLCDVIVGHFALFFQVFCPGFCLNDVVPDFMRVTSATSGNEVVVLDDDFEEFFESNGRSVLTLKKYLSRRIAQPRFRQRILDGGDGELCDKQEISAPVELQLVLLDIWPPEQHNDAEFIAACANNQVDKVEVMLQRPQNPDTRDSDGWPALHFAAEAGNVRCVELLLESGADLESTATEDGSTALHCAAWNGHLEVLKLLLEAGARKHRATSQGQTAFCLAVGNSHIEVMQYLEAWK